MKEFVSQTREKFNEFINENKTEPNYALCLIKYHNDENTFEDIIKLSCDDGNDDDEIFYYCNGLEDLVSLFEEGSGEDFRICEVIRFSSDI